MPRGIKEVLGEFTRAGANGTRVEVDAKLAVMVASELKRATHAVSTNLTELGMKIGGLTNQIEVGAQRTTAELEKLTTALTDGAKALDVTVQAGNRLSSRIWWLNVFVVLLMVVQIWLGWKALPTH
jgi:hypothetical protein